MSGAYFADGMLYCLCAEDFQPIDINNNGIYVANVPGSGGMIGFGGNLHQVGYAGFFTYILGINDRDQILFKEIGGYEVMGVLSPFAIPDPSASAPVPEPSAFLLFATAVCLGTLKLATRRDSI